MPTFLVEYTFSPSTASTRDVTRPAHRAWLSDRLEAGDLLASGPYTDGLGALLIFRAADETAVQALLQQDPYLPVAAIEAATVTRWTPVFGPITD